MSSAMTTAQVVCGAAFLSVYAAKYTKTAVGCYTYLTFKPIPVKDKPKYTAADVSVIIPTTYDVPHELAACVERVEGCGPASIIVVCPEERVSECKQLMADTVQPKVTVIGVERLNKRVQILKALDYVNSDIVVLADDDVFWPSPDYLTLLLAIFDDDSVGARGTRQRVRRDEPISKWNFWGIGYLERRVWNNATTNAIDGSISTLSGRTAAYRAEILQTSKFRHYFANDSWRGKPLNSDDDKCLTRYVYSNGWKIQIQFDKQAVLETTVENGPKYLHQCLRWARAHWRGNHTVMENETYWYSKEMLWGTYAIYLGSYLTPAFLWEALMWALLWGCVGGTSWAKSSYIAFALTIFFTKLVKYVPHFCRHPKDLIYIAHAIGFSYFHGLLNLYAYATMTTTHWGSRDVVEVSAARELMESTWTSDHAVEFATAGHATRFSEGGQDYFRASVPGSVVKSKVAIEKSADGSVAGAITTTIANDKLIDDSVPEKSTKGYTNNNVEDGMTDQANNVVETDMAANPADGRVDGPNVVTDDYSHIRRACTGNCAILDGMYTCLCELERQRARAN